MSARLPRLRRFVSAPIAFQSASRFHPGAKQMSPCRFCPTSLRSFLRIQTRRLPVPASGTQSTGRLKKAPGLISKATAEKEIAIFSDATPGTKSLVVVALVAGASQATIPDWLGKRPPVEGNWVQTFAEEFDGPALDNKMWNIYGVPAWDKWTRFSKNNVILKDGNAHLGTRRKPGSIMTIPMTSSGRRITRRGC